ncbi:MAG: CDGSH iron-sulfur domain-containing protein [Myxococcales bacterium]|nr:CDGSH iron-sulfur domain-containing protein [Myxococcales bacterium]
MSKKKTFRYEGADGTVAWNGGLCIHVGECGRATGDLFVGGRKPWCKPDEGGQRQDVLQVLQRCPTGALSFEENGVPLDEEPPTENRIAVSNNGPLYVSGQLEVDGATEDMPSVRYRAALCRCGQSKNKPFCDNTHEEAGFRDHGAIGDRGTELGSEGGPLKVSRAPNGPLLVQGNLRLVAASGRVAWSGTKAALCRCGQSSNKPFCDGSHKAAGFEAE